MNATGGVWVVGGGVVFFFKQKTAYEIVSRDWSSDVCSSDLFSYNFYIMIQYTLFVKYYTITFLSYTTEQ